MTEIIALSNQKGGVGKTTSTINIGTELSLLGHRVLIIDFDPQGSASSGVGVELDSSAGDLYDLFLGDAPLNEIIKATKIKRLDIAPASKDLVSIEVEIGKQQGRELILKSEIANLTTEYDYILIDCPPSSGLLTLNALGAANWVLVPLQAEYYALEGLSALMETINFTQKTFNTKLNILGVFITMYDARTRLSQQVYEESAEFFKEKMFKTKIPRNIKISESPSHALPIALYAPESKGAEAYQKLTEEMLNLMAKATGSSEKKAANF